MVGCSLSPERSPPETLSSLTLPNEMEVSLPFSSAIAADSTPDQGGRTPPYRRVDLLEAVFAGHVPAGWAPHHCPFQRRWASPAKGKRDSSSPDRYLPPKSLIPTTRRTSNPSSTTTPIGISTTNAALPVVVWCISRIPTTDK